MRTKYFFTICVIFFLFPCITISSASENWGGTLGLSSWYPRWTSDNSQFSSSTSGLYGPALFVHYRNFGLGFQYFRGDFDLLFPGSTHEISADRTDFDLIMSYRITRKFQLSVLYKSIQYDWNQTFSLQSELTGFGFGGGFNHVFPDYLMMYGFGFYMPSLDYEQTISQGGNISGEADGFWIEAGVGYIVAHPRLLARIGYRYQAISIESGSALWDEKTDGIRADISYYF